ncbi:uncharacterized protein FIBRA_03063 [Fibroporia radiculosa]|uniref:DH domain-containing protein n=1 Tax=Fibroporia radiculosa TaxID=599839 RepID=J4GN98_9APHY|nr:uncharacterized protein FIBRA_03063 [Fibroporia radiculosa]CCM01015.1 predicted protein [Fibroporia radiculosa]
MCPLNFLTSSSLTSYRVRSYPNEHKAYTEEFLAPYTASVTGQRGQFHTEMTSSGQESPFENVSFSEPHSCRVDLASPPSSSRLSTSTTETSESASWSTPPSSPNPSSPPRPPRSPLRPTVPAPARRASASLLKLEKSDLTPTAETMPLSHSRSFGSFSGLLNPQPPSIKSGRSGRPQTPDKPLPITPDPSTAPSGSDDDRDQEESASQSASVTTSVSEPSSLLQQPSVVSKRTHALQELLSTERTYASDLALIRDIHIPLALGQPAPFQTAPATPPPSEPSSRTQSTSSDTASTSSSISTTSPPMTREDTRIIFNNVADLASFSDTFTEQIEEALGSVLEGGSGEDRVGALFLETIPTLEPLYLSYITKHPTALEHLNHLPQTPALTAYLAQSRALASSLTHAWDLPSLLIKPVQRLLKYPLLLAAIIDETPDGHLDKPNLKLAREKMEEVARGVNEGRRRREVVKEVLSGPPSSLPSKRHSDPKPKPKKKGLNIGVSASVSLGRMKGFSSKPFKAKEGVEADQEAEEVLRLGEEVKRCEALARALAKEAINWSQAMQDFLQSLKAWSMSFGQVIGVTTSGDSEAFDAYMQVVRDDLPEFCRELEASIKNKLLTELTKLVDSTLAPLRLLEAMQTLEPLHLGLLNLNIAKSRPPPQLLEASQSYVALRGQLAAELPQYIALMKKGITLCVLRFSTFQADFFGRVRDRWLVLWNALKVGDEMNAGAPETVRVWWSRFEETDARLLGMNIIRRRSESPKLVRQKSKATINIFDDDFSETSSTVVVSSIASSWDPLSSPSTLSLQTPVSTKARSVRSMEIGNRRGVERKLSDESLRSKKSARSAKSTKSLGHVGSYCVNGFDSDEIAYAYGTLATLTPSAQKPRYTRTKSMPIPAPLPLKKSQSHGRMLDDVEITRMQVPTDAEIESLSEIHPSPPFANPDRGRPSRKPSFKRRLTESFRPGSASSTSRRSPAPLGPSPSPSPNKAMFAPHHHQHHHHHHQHRDQPHTNSSNRYSSRRPSSARSRIPALYECEVVHMCEPPPGVSYRNLPFFTLCVGDYYSVLQEAGHPSTHKDLPLYVDDGEDCLLLVRNKVDDIGWALASFLVPTD